MPNYLVRFSEIKVKEIWVNTDNKEEAVDAVSYACDLRGAKTIEDGRDYVEVIETCLCGEEGDPSCAFCIREGLKDDACPALNPKTLR